MVLPAGTFRCRKIDMTPEMDLPATIENAYGTYQQIVVANILLDKFQIGTKKSELQLRAENQGDKNALYQPYYLRNNMYVTSSGINTPEVMEFCIRVLGPDRIMYSADYPFASFAGSEKLLENPSVSRENLEKFAYKNAERLLKIRV